MSCYLFNTYYLIGNNANEEARKVAEWRESVTKTKLRITKSCPWCVELQEDGNHLSPIFLAIDGFVWFTFSVYDADWEAFLMGLIAHDVGWAKRLGEMNACRRST